MRAVQVTMSIFLTELSECINSKMAACIVKKYLHRENTYLNLKFMMWFVGFRHRDVRVCSKEIPLHKNVKNELEISTLSDFYEDPSEHNFQLVVGSNLSASQLNTFYDTVFTKKFTQMFQTRAVYDEFKTVNVYIECLIGENVETIKNSILALGEFEYGIPVAMPTARRLENVYSDFFKYIQGRLESNDLVEIVPNDYIKYQVHYSKARGVIVYDSDFNLIENVDDFLGLFGTDILSAGIVVHRSLRCNSTRVSDVFYINTIGRDVDLRCFPLWKRVEYLQKYFNDVSTTYCHQFKHLNGKKDYCIIFKDKSSRFLYNIDYNYIQKGQIEVRIISGITDYNCDYVSRYNVKCVNTLDSVGVVDIMDLDIKIREYLLYNLRPTLKLTNRGITTVKFSDNVRVFGYCLKNRKTFKISKCIMPKKKFIQKHI